MKSLCLILLLAISATPACSRFTTSGRQQRAYAKYIKKSKITREKRQARFRQEKTRVPRPEEMQPSEPQETIQMSEGPQSVTTHSGNQ